MRPPGSEGLDGWESRWEAWCLGELGPHLRARDRLMIAIYLVISRFVSHATFIFFLLSWEGEVSYVSFLCHSGFGKYFWYFIFIYLFIFSSTSLLLPTHLPPPSCTHAQSCNPMDFSLPDSSVHGFLQSRILEWSAISFSIFVVF